MHEKLGRQLRTDQGGDARGDLEALLIDCASLLLHLAKDARVSTVRLGYHVKGTVEPPISLSPMCAKGAQRSDRQSSLRAGCGYSSSMVAT